MDRAKKVRTVYYKPLFGLMTVPTGADAKVRGEQFPYVNVCGSHMRIVELLRMSAYLPSTAYVFFAGSHDAGYMVRHRTDLQRTQMV